MLRKLSIVTLIAVAVITAYSIHLISQLRFDYDFEKFFPWDHPETEFYQEFRTTFETDNDFIFIGLVNEEGIFDPGFLAKTDSLTSDLNKIDNVVEVLSPTRIEEIILDPVFGGVFKKPALRWNEPENYAADSTSIYNNENYIGTFFSSDRHSIALHLKHKQGMSKTLCDKISYDIENLMKQYDFDESHVIGRALGQRIYVDMMVDELIMFIIISALLTLVFLYIAFRSAWSIVIPMLIVIITILWTMGMMKLMGKDIDIMLTILPTIIFVVGVSDSVHVLTRYLFELRNGVPKIQALFYALKSAGPATFLTAFTSAIGFGTLYFNSIKPISDFGLYTGAGVMLAFFITYIMIPAAMVLAPAPKVKLDENKSDYWTRNLHNGFRLLLRHRKKVLWIGGGVTVALMSGMFLLKSNNYMLEDLQEDHILKQEFHFAEDHFAGVRPFEMAIELKNGIDPFDPVLLEELNKLDHYLRKEYGVGHLLSPVKLIKEASKTLNGGSADFYEIPDNALDLGEIKKLLQKKGLKEIRDLLIDDKKQMLRFTGKLGDVGRNYYEEKNIELADFVRTQIKPGLFEYKLTGTAVLIDLNNTYLTENMFWGLLGSILIIGLLMAFLYRSILVGIISVIPNILPLAVVAGIMGYTGINLKISTSIIFSIAFGIAVDDTIHYLVKLQLYIKQGYSVAYANKRTMMTTGKAMIVTSLILCAGFITLIFSDFMGTYYIGFLIGLTLLLALVFELALTPLLMLYFYKPSKLAINQETDHKSKSDSPGH